jgi:hypothetical protein
METAQLLWQQVTDYSTLPTALLATGILVLLLVPKLRRIVHDILETVIASLLLLVLILVVLGLPFGESCVLLHFFFKKKGVTGWTCSYAATNPWKEGL